MTDYIYCRRVDGSHDLIDFFIETSGRNIFLFRQHYTTTVYDRFRNGCRLEEALRFRKAGRAMENFNEKLPKYLKYIEKEEGIKIMGKVKNEKRKSA